MPALYSRVALLDRQRHRGQRVRPFTDFTPAAGLNAVYCAAAEFAEACKCFPLLFIRGGEADAGGSGGITPVCLLGLENDENLFVDQGAWQAAYLPAFLRRYPFALARVPAPEAPLPAGMGDSLVRVRELALQARAAGKAAGAGTELDGLAPSAGPRPAELVQAVAVDEDFTGLGLQLEGELLFGEDGEPTPHLQAVMRFLNDFDDAAERTRPVGPHLASLGLLKEMRAQGPLPGGRQFSVDGFLVVDENKLAGLPDAAVLALHRSGLLALIHAHLLSLSNLHALVERKTQRLTA
jgi:hypothetical protein